jgi:hypothetical protein
MRAMTTTTTMKVMTMVNMMVNMMMMEMKTTRPTPPRCTRVDTAARRQCTAAPGQALLMRILLQSPRRENGPHIKNHTQKPHAIRDMFWIVALATAAIAAADLPFVCPDVQTVDNLSLPDCTWPVCHIGPSCAGVDASDVSLAPPLPLRLCALTKSHGVVSCERSMRRRRAVVSSAQWTMLAHYVSTSVVPRVPFRG